MRQHTPSMQKQTGNPPAFLCAETLPLRAHHALCLQHWQGRGYSPAFTREMNRVAALLARAPETRVRLLDRPDGFCACCPNLAGRACASPKPARYDAAALAAMQLPAGAVLPWRTLLPLAHELARKSLAAICGDCQWFFICGVSDEET